MHKAIFKQWIAFFVMITLMGITYLAGATSRKGSLLVWCLWDVIFVFGGLFGAVRPMALLRIIGDPLSKPLPRTAQIIIRCFGIFAFLLGAMMAINLAVNFSAYWNGLY